MTLKISLKGTGDKTPWWEEGTQEHPLNNRARLVGSQETGVGMFVVSNHSLLKDQAHIGELRAITRGGGRAALTHLTQEADKYGKTLTVLPSPMSVGKGQEGVEMPKSKLRVWYSKFGFIPDKNDTMVRPPKKVEIKKSFVRIISDKIIKHLPQENLEDIVMPANDPGIFVFRPVLNEDQWLSWAKEKGITIDAKGGLHVTVFGSTKLIPWVANESPMILSPKRYLGFEILGKDKALVLMLRSPEIKTRWALAKEKGANLVHAECKPHMTICYNSHTGIEMPNFSLMLGGEVMREYKKPEELK